MVKSSYAKTLRAIAQDLEARGLKTFDLKPQGNLYVVACGYREPPSDTPVMLEYTREDIEEMDRSGRAKRGKVAPPSEFVTLVQILRAVGGFLDKNRCRLIALSNNHLPSKELMLRLEYDTAEGERVVDDRTGAALYGLCVSMYKRRGKDASDRYVYLRRKAG